jgi:hypothetical protein
MMWSDVLRIHSQLRPFLSESDAGFGPAALLHGKTGRVTSLGRRTACGLGRVASGPWAGIRQ